MTLGSAAVIFGAGASSDCVDLPVEQIVAEARPPLTSGIFDPSFGQFFAPYSDASMLVSTIKAQLRDGLALEAILRDFSQAAALHRRAQFLQLPLYLRDLFTWVGNTYTPNPTNYSHLANELIANFERVVFVTLNYDCLLEKVLSVPSLGGPIRTLEDYNRPRWSLSKLHGSVEWVRRSREILVPTNIQGDARTSTYLGALTDLAYSHMALDDIFDPEVSMPQHRIMMLEGYLYYPAIVVPVEGKYGFACPVSIVQRLERDLEDCSSVLIVGASGKDTDLIDLLARHLGRVLNYHFVGRGTETPDAARRFNPAVAQLAQAPMSRIHDNGFTGFLAGGFAQFVADARSLAGE
jgi:hypothetical protein